MSKLQAHANRLTPSAYDDYEEEPTTKLSTAFVVVLVLHLVAVGGVYAFHSIKAQRREADGTATTASAVQSSPASVMPAPAAPLPAVPAGHGAQAPVQAALAQKQPGSAAVKTDAPVSRATATLAAPAGPSAVMAPKAAPNQVAAPVATVAVKALPGSVTPVKAAAVVPAVAPVQPAVGAGNDGVPKTYTVVKGDNPVAIAKKMGVNYDEMLKLNGVEDPKKLRIGQILKMPAKKQGN